jgi:hypothetical protein
MNVTREVISDLWPIYASGEASADTRAVVEEFLKNDQGWSRMLRSSDAVSWEAANAPELSPNMEAKAMTRTKRVLHKFDWSFFLAMLFSAFAFGRIISDTSFDVSPRNFIITAVIAACFWAAFGLRTAWVRRKVYRETMAK